MSNKLIWLLSIVLLTSFSPRAMGQDAPAENAEKLKALNWILGDWEWEGEWRRPGEPVEKFVYLVECELALGGNFIEIEMVPKGAEEDAAVHKGMIGWDPESERFVGQGFWDDGFHEEVYFAKINDETWTVTREGLEGKFSKIKRGSFEYEATFVDENGEEGSWSLKATRTIENEREVILDAWAKDFVGAYFDSGDLEEEIPGFAEKGAEFTNRLEIGRNSNGLFTATAQLMVGSKIGPKANATAGWDAANKQVKFTWFNDFGDSGTRSFSFNDGSWSGSDEYISGEGQTQTQDFEVTIINSEHRYRNFNVKLDGEPQPDNVEVWKKQ